ncbi:ATP-grasp domain-containing protein [Polyangium sorediatum]|uniref:ATP-grasp domain-containing protein n=1 Tax=Polyangium sorediatum TaxID=889274 RepID=A0ABT6P2E7_9BACT|nr:ATP-grasp domain-containing protein [Polyangium sorediatum]MDI1434733.1 ATP-grasp domain-containing protein [Polyangium sorediatum]
MPEQSLVPAVLCGDLNMVRCFSGDAPAEAGLPVPRIPFVVASTRAGDPTFGSRYVARTAVLSDPVTNPDQTAEDLRIVAERTGGRPVLFYGTDAMLLCISRHREMLERHYRFLLPPAERVEDLVDKARFATLARRLGLPVPATVASAEARTRAEVMARVPLPCAVKPVNHTSFRTSAAVREEGGLPWKAFFARTPEELDKRLAQMRRSGTAFVVQRYVRGGDDHITSFHAWMNARGEPVAHHVGKKIRTYPSGSGESTFIEIVEDPEVTRVGLEVVRALGLVGVVKLDFKRDAETGELFLLEANPRFNLWNRLGAASGVNLPLVAYAELAGLPLPHTGPVRPGLRWASVEGDVRAFLLDYGPSGAVSLRDFVASYRGPKVFDVFAWDDPWPLVLTLAKRVGQRARRAGGKAGRP